MSLLGLWQAFLRFLAALFARPSPATLPAPVTASAPSPPPQPTPVSSTARTSPACRSRSATPAFADISFSGVFTTPDFRLSTPPGVQFASQTPSAVLVRPDRSALSPTTMSDGSLEIISLGDPPLVVPSPVSLADIGSLPSPWSPVGKSAPPHVWMSVDGVLTNAAGPVQDDSASSLYSTSSALDAFGISVFVSLDEARKSSDVDHPKPTVTPRKRRDTLPSHATTQSARSVKHRSTPLTKLDNIGVSHVRSATSISSMAYELRMGLFADGRSMSAFENFISLLDQASPESTRATPIQPVVVG